MPSGHVTTCHISLIWQMRHIARLSPISLNLAHGTTCTKENKTTFRTDAGFPDPFNLRPLKIRTLFYSTAIRQEALGRAQISKVELGDVLTLERPRMAFLK